jgi:outer membrane lipoprotein
MRAHVSVVALLLLSGCASPLPEPLREPPPVDLTLAQAREDTAAHVRWGGRIAAIENRADATWIDIVARELDGNGRPRDTDDSFGRFLARVPGFLDPAVYVKAREVTVAGVIDGAAVRPIGDYRYRYVVVHADAVHLWDPRVTPREMYRSPYYDPVWYDPLWPWRPYPGYAPYPYW